LLFQLLNPFLMVFFSSIFMSEFFKSTSNESLVVGYSAISCSPANYSVSGPYPSCSGNP
jgi:threonine/homoserine/homoserine lactone efflux protein